MGLTDHLGANNRAVFVDVGPHSTYRNDTLGHLMTGDDGNDNRKEQNRSIGLGSRDEGDSQFDRASL